MALRLRITKWWVGTTRCQLGKAGSESLGGGEEKGLASRVLSQSQCSLCMSSGATGTYRSVEPRECSKLATTRFLIFQLTTARILCFVFCFPITGCLSFIPRIPLPNSSHTKDATQKSRDAWERALPGASRATGSVGIRSAKGHLEAQHFKPMTYDNTYLAG